MKYRRRYVASRGCCSLIALAASFNPAHAQQATSPEIQPADAAGVQDIIVTARRRTESLLDVPVAVTMVSQEEIELRSVRGLDDMQRIAPGLQISQNGRGAAASFVSLRGQSTASTSIIADPAVGIYFDEVYLGRTAGNLVSSLQDMASVQVLRGPQGTLFGRNNTGGAILLTPNRPTLNGFSGNVSLAAGSYSFLQYGGIVDAALIDDVLGVRLSFQKTDRDGIGRSVTTGIDSYGNRNRNAGRASVRLRPAVGATLDFTYDFSNIDETGGALVFAPTADQYDFFENRSGLQTPEQKVTTRGYTLRGEFEVSPALTLKAIGSYRTLRTGLNSDIDGTPAALIDAYQFSTQRQWTGELQASGVVLKDAGSWLKEATYTAGAYYFREKGTDGSALPVPLPADITVAPRYVNAFATNSSKAAYAQLETNTADRLFLTAGARYTKDRRKLANQAASLGTCTLATIPAGTPLDQCLLSGSDSFGYWSYTGGARFQFNPRANVYIKYDKGQRAGGLDDSPTSIETFDPEIVKSLEVGLKADWLDRRLQTNIALYKADVQNVQRVVQLLDSNNIPYASIFNAASSRVKGIEAEVNLVPVDGLTLSGSYAYTDAKYNEFIDPTTGADLSALKYPDVPKHTYTLAAAYEVPIKDLGRLHLRVDHAYRSFVYFDPFNFPLAVQDSYAITNARIQVDLDGVRFGKGISIAGYVRNLADIHYNTGGSSTAGGGLFRTEEPRSFNMELRVNF